MKHIIFDCDGTLIDTTGIKFTLFPGIKELLSDLAEQNTLYVWTARGKASTIRALEEMGIAHYFADISTPDDSLSKPHIAGLLDLVGHAAKSSVCVIGDSSNDMFGAKNFGVLAIGASWNSSPNKEFLQDAGADFIVSHPSECSKIIELNLKGDAHV